MSIESDFSTAVSDIVDILNLGVDDIKALRQSADENAKRLDGLLHLMTDMVKLEDQIKKMEENIEKRLSRLEASGASSSKLVDQVIEMSMVQAGQAAQAVLHRSQSRLDKKGFDSVEWGRQIEDEEEDVWPPPGYDAMTG